MRLFVYLLSAILTFSSINSFSQCVTDYEFIPDGSYGLSPDSLPSGNLMEEYEEDLTFYLPIDTLVDILGSSQSIAFEDFHIISISLPLGLEWECNNFENQCHYNPQESQHGCVRVSGTPLQQGLFDVQVTVIATHEASDLVGTEEISFSLPLYIGPGSINNDGFSMSNYSGCTPLEVNFTNNNPGLAMYEWNMGNNMTTQEENPGTITYYEPGSYVISYDAYSVAETQYNLTNVTIQAASGWGWDPEDILSNAPDPYFLILDQQGSEIYLSTFIENQNFPVSYDVNINLQPNQNYTIQVYDDDGSFAGDDDYLGQVTFNSNNLNGVLNDGDLMVSYSTEEVNPSPIISVFDTVYVYEYPEEVEIIYDEDLPLFSLVGDSLDLNYQWNIDDIPVALANNITHTPTQSGYYSLSIVNNDGCGSSTESILSVICYETYSPSVDVENNMLYCNNPVNFDCQWYLDGIIILGATTNELLANSHGEYSVVQTDEWGCIYESDPFTFTPSDINNNEIQSIEVYPNPFTSNLRINLSNIESEVNISLYDNKGALVRNYINVFQNEFTINRANLKNGIYSLKIQNQHINIRKKIIVSY